MTVGGDLSASGTLTADTIVAHTLLSATNLDITYELSGFSVTGDISASGGLSAYNGYFVDKVGIGINTPDTTLHVCATDPRVRVDATAGNHPGFEFSEDGSRCWVMYNDPDASDTLTFKSSTDVFTINTSGDICASGTVCGSDICGTTSVCSPAVCGTTSVTAPAVCGSTSVCGALISDGMSCLNGSGTVCGCYGCFDSGVCVSSDICASGTVCGYNVCGTGSVCGYTGCFTGDLCGSGLVYGGGCVCGACVTDGYSCLDGSGNVCGSYIYGSSCVCGAVVTDGYSCFDGSGYVCASYGICSTGDICATSNTVCAYNLCASSGTVCGYNVCASGGTVCGYYVCADYLYKGSGSFNIAHPLESKKDTHKLVHSFIEGPQADNIYSGSIKLTSGNATVNIDNCAGMTEGTFVALNRCVRSFTTNETNWDPVKGSVSGNVLTVESCVADSTAQVSWMVLGERQDVAMTNPNNPMTDSGGHIIVEPIKPALSGEE